MENLRFKVWDKVNEIYFNHVDIIDFVNGIIICYSANDGEQFEVEFESAVVMQSTVLKDKNGVEIFEGDIVKVQAEDPEPKIRADRYETGVMIYDYGSFDIVTKSKRVSGLIPESYLTDIQLTFEVIGNQFEHPNLLKE